MFGKVLVWKVFLTENYPIYTTIDQLLNEIEIFTKVQ